MTLPNGTISMSQVNTELGRPSTQSINLNDSAVRALAGRPSGTISMSDLRGKSNVTQATGGTIVTLGSTKYHIFTGPGTFSVSVAASPVNYLVVAGGGGAGTANVGAPSQAGQGGPGGGGGGGFRAGSTGISATNYPVSVGGGGASPNTPRFPGVQGSPSSIFGVTSTGGGFGSGGGGQGSGFPPTSPFTGLGGPGGSGGGSGSSGGNGYSVTRPGGSGTSGQGNPGGDGFFIGSTDTSWRPILSGAGGGGSAAVGGARRPPPAPWNPNFYFDPYWRGGVGGSGSTQPWLPSSLPVGQTSGSFKYFSGGGGGCCGLPYPGTFIPSPSFTAPLYNASISPGGLGGGGTGAGITNSAPLKYGTPGTVNTGGGGGGGYGAPPGIPATVPPWGQGNGGSGVVIVSYPV